MTKENALNTWLPLVEMAIVDADIPEAKEALEIAIQNLERNVWTPVSKKLPDKDGDYLVTFSSGRVDICPFAKDLYAVDDYDFADRKNQSGWYDYDRDYGYYLVDNIVAWMPLPKGYGEE